MPALRDDIDPDGLLEYSVVYTDRSLNHMSAVFVDVMQRLTGILRDTYHGESVALVPGGGTYAMEAVARQLATGKRCLILRNGFFSYRWSQIFDAGSIPASSSVLKAAPVDDSAQAPFSPAAVDDVLATIERERPEVVFAPHVETASGIVLPDDYVRAVGEATRASGGVFVLDCIASGALWVDMADTLVDVLISAPQKGWSGSPGAGYVVLGERGRAAVESTTSTSFAANLRTWLSIADGYLEGKAAYHATLPTDTLRHNLGLMEQTVDAGLEQLRERQIALGTGVRALLAERGFPSVAAPGYEASGVVVSYTDDPEIQNVSAFRKAGIQAAAGVPLFCDEPDGFSTFRLGLFGLDKWADVDGTVDRLRTALDAMGR